MRDEVFGLSIDSKIAFDEDFRKRLSALVVAWVVLEVPEFRAYLGALIETAVPTMSAAGIHELDVGRAIVTPEALERLRLIVEGNPFLAHAVVRSEMAMPHLEWRLQLDVGRMVRARPDWSEIRHRIRRDMRRQKTVRKVINS